MLERLRLSAIPHAIERAANWERGSEIRADTHHALSRGIFDRNSAAIRVFTDGLEPPSQDAVTS
jgi:hypothetical protein